MELNDAAFPLLRYRDGDNPMDGSNANQLFLGSMPVRRGCCVGPDPANGLSL